MTKKITIPYFPQGIKYVTPLILVGVFYLALINYYGWSVILVLLIGIILTTKYVTEINLNDKKYVDYLSLLWIPLNVETKTFNHLDRIVITKGNHAQTINTTSLIIAIRVQSRQLDWSDYTGTLITDNGTLDLLTRNSKRELMIGLKEFAEFLNVGIEDRTSSQYYWVDLTRT